MDNLNTTPFEIKETGDATGELWFGRFVAKQRLSLRDQLNRDKIRRDLLGEMGGSADVRAASIAMIVSELIVRLVEFPDWWKEQANGLDMADENVVVKVYDAAMKAESDANEARKAKAEAAKEALKQSVDTSQK